MRPKQRFSLGDATAVTGSFRAYGIGRRPRYGIDRRSRGARTHRACSTDYL
ncbi:MAG: hypothetical protein F6K50_42535 [Moorea sp. SIO3I7]|nr:hypothetical protein [Moorena sp. SIO3I7]